MSTAASDRASSVDAVVVGAGFSGLYQLYKLREVGLSCRGIEAGDDVGGTWHWNRYPGARCDVESIYYSYSFSPELEQEWEWSERYPAQPELHRYLRHVADRFDLRREITFDTRVVSAHYDADGGRWRVTTDTGETIETRYLIMATGCLSVPKQPEVPGIDSFAGPIYHTSRWPVDGVDFTGLRVGLIGTGSSGVQSIPLIARQAEQLTVFQRTACFSMPAKNRPRTPEEQIEVKGRYRDIRAEQRQAGFGSGETAPTISAHDVSDEERQRTYQAAWDKGDLVALFSAYTDIVTDIEANETAAEFVRSKIREIVADPDVADALSPYSYPYGTKRPCIDTDYYETFNRENVRLVDLRRSALAEVTERGIRTMSDDLEFDALVFATGFDAITGALLRVDIRGRDGLVLREKWAEGPRTYLGVAVAGFPNLFTITGPGSPAVFSNMVVSIEQHVEWVSDCIAHLEEQGYRRIEAEVAAEDEWVAHVAEVADSTLYPLADSWYVGANVPGKPRVIQAYLGGCAVYRELCDKVAANSYEGFVLA